ncbi:TonB-dependent receptor plug domain-containing protein [Arenicella xantha]|uniref:Iron complex outermembrane receptor protein n=1 Tax=Arenicella xantha TaxID=644221 RepID=A0A395JNS9_9GAMM|nr:TonB-dependent receptor [Arenicella xantha]RBP51447.1 iron complex outermembrane receptor protein [Arenicella xantha]
MTRFSKLSGWVFLVLFLSASTASMAAERDGDEEFYFSIPRLSADKALTRFARQADLTLLFPYQEVKKFKTRPLHGRFTIHNGLRLMLSGTNIVLSTGLGDVGDLAEPTGDDLSQEIDESTITAANEPRRFSTIKLAVVTADSNSATQSDEPELSDSVEEIVILGSRSAKARSITGSPVPVDVISAEQFSALGNGADITDSLKNLVPSYNATPATGDGSAFVRPTSLRGMSPDQTLVLVNGKRRHRSALVHFFAPAAGNGSHGVDVAMIPSIALKNVQIMRDGAAAQYGSDAIAGVINFDLRDAREGGQIRAAYGQFYDGEMSTKVAANLGFGVGDYGFLNASLEVVDNEALSRGVIRPDTQALIDAGVSGVGADSPFGDAPFTQTWGRPESSGSRLFVNSGYDLANGAELYAFGNYADTHGRYRFFYRDVSHPSISDLGLLDALPAGYTPYLDGEQTDMSLVSGLRGEFTGGSIFDFSWGYGKNKLDYFLFNTLNPSLPLLADGSAVRDFDVGAYQQEEINIGVDFSTQITDLVSLSYGVEYREETFTLVPGDANSLVGEGPSGFSSPSLESAGSFDRDNVAVYADLEHDISDRWLMQYALRYENFSDFGGTANGKIATRYNLNQAMTLRGAISTGFHAPTPGQANISSVITTFDGRTGSQIEEGLVPANSAAARDAGGTELKEEVSTNLSFGFTTSLGSAWDLTVDFYRVDVEDRIYRTGDIPILGANGRTLSFYTNALDIEHQGADVVLNGSFDWGDTTNTTLTFAYAHNEIKVSGQTPVAGINPVSASTIEDIENNYPDDRFTLSANTSLRENLNLLLRAAYYGSHFDERGMINGLPGDRSAKIEPIVFVDAELGWQYSDEFELVLGVSNLFDSYVDEIADDGVFANRQEVGLQYPRRTAANYEGGSWYLKGILNF